MLRIYVDIGVNCAFKELQDSTLWYERASFSNGKERTQSVLYSTETFWTYLAINFPDKLRPLALRLRPVPGIRVGVVVLVVVLRPRVRLRAPPRIGGDQRKTKISSRQHCLTF
jgi:hypothetical protein